jgi:RNA polymerase sigma factor (sigma-70 family)
LGARGGRCESGIFSDKELLIYKDWSVDNGVMEAARTRAPLAVDGATAPSRYLLRLASDEKLVSRIRGGSERAFTVLYERHHRGILSFCRHMLGSREEAEDAVQQAFANAYRSMLGSDKEINLKPWLYRIARNQCISLLRARRHDSILGDDEPSLAGLSDQVAQRDELRRLLEDLAGLPVDQREAIVLAELHDNSHVEVAAILGCEREKVKSLVFQARSSLMKSREARDLPCEEVRRQLSVLRGGSLRRNTIRRHLQHCDGCRAFRNEVKRQRQAMAVILPVIPSASLKLGAANAIAAAGVKAASTAIGGGVAAGGAGAGGAGAAGPAAALAGKLGVSTAAVKGVAATVAVTVVAGGGAVAVKERNDALRDSGSVPIERSDDGASPGAKGPGGAAAALGPGAAAEAARDRAKARREDRRRRRGVRERSRQGGKPGSKGSGPATARGPVPPTAKRNRFGAERRQVAKERRLERRERRKQADRPRKYRKRPVRRRPAARKPEPRTVQPPVGTSPADPPPAERSPDGGATFPSR